MRKRAKKNWSKATTLLTDSLKRLGVSEKKVTEARILAAARQIVAQELPALYEQIEVISYTGGTLSLRVISKDPFLQNELRLSEAKLMERLKEMGVQRIRL